MTGENFHQPRVFHRKPLLFVDGWFYKITVISLSGYDSAAIPSEKHVVIV
jgi:hypothetical protein